MKTDLDLTFKVLVPVDTLEARAWRLQDELSRREYSDVDDIDLSVNMADRTVTVHLLVTATSEAETLAKAMSVVVPSIYATGDSVDLGQHRGMSTGSSGVWQPDLELTAAASG